jgi:hypothetical protein
MTAYRPFETEDRLRGEVDYFVFFVLNGLGRFDYGRTQTYTDRNGHFSGSAVNNSNGTTSNRNGSFSGSAGSSIDRAFNFNKR